MDDRAFSTLDAQAMIEHARCQYRLLNNREPDTDGLILTLGYLAAYLARHVPAGFIGWPPAREVAPPRPPRPAITDDEPETATE